MHGKEVLDHRRTLSRNQRYSPHYATKVMETEWEKNAVEATERTKIAENYTVRRIIFKTAHTKKIVQNYKEEKEEEAEKNMRFRAPHVSRIIGNNRLFHFVEPEH